MSNPNSCFFYPVENPCPQKRPSKCPVHGPIMARPRLKLHYLASQRKGWPPWSKKDLRMLPTTVCGIYLHERYTLEQVVELRGPLGHKTEKQILEEDWINVEPPPSKTKGVEIYYQVSWHRRELAVVTTGATCVPCSKKGPI